MRQAIGTTWLMQLVIVFTLIMVAFITLTINYTKAFKLKNEVISMIERNEGFNETQNGTVTLINNYLMYNGYSVTGSCNSDEYGMISLNDVKSELGVSGQKYYYCIQKIKRSSPTFTDRVKYKIRIFYHFNLPILGDFLTFSIEGSTIDINQSATDIVPT